MRTIPLLLAAIFTLTLCFSVVPEESFAKSEAKELAPAADKKVAKKAIPENIDINTADKALLVQLPGIGPKTADLIIKFRKENGNFESINDLTKVKGIGDKTMIKLKPYLMKV
jgi:competence protein ComEA